MRAQLSLLLLLLCAYNLTAAELRRYSRSKNRVSLLFSDGVGTIEWISASTFRFSRHWSRQGDRAKPFSRESVQYELEDLASSLRLKTKYLTVAVQKAPIRVIVKDADGLMLSQDLEEPRRQDGTILLERSAAPAERFHGLDALTSPQLDLRGSALTTSLPFLISSQGYGLSFKCPGSGSFDLAMRQADRCRIVLSEVTHLDYFFYYGPSPKEILEEHNATVDPLGDFSLTDLAILNPGTLPSGARPLPAPAASWNALRTSLRALLHAGFSAILLPAFDLSAWEAAPRSLYSRAVQLGAMVPLVYHSRTPGKEVWCAAILDAASVFRRRWGPFLLTYLDEARDRGFPILRPLPLQYPKDTEAPNYSDQFMLGDEVLVAPICSDATERDVYLPMGIWTQLRTNTVHKGRQLVRVQAPIHEPPLFVRNGSILPLAGLRESDPMQLHYFPRLAAEFFLSEPDVGVITQFHAAPAGEFMRLEIDSRTSRQYEWIAHHLDPVRSVHAGDVPYVEVADSRLLRPGSWHYSSKTRNLHVRVTNVADQELILNITFR